MTGLLMIAVLALAGQQDARHRVPPPREAKSCETAADPDERPKHRFERKGGRTTRATVRTDGGALTVDGVAQGRDLGRYDKLDVANPQPRLTSEIERDPLLARARSFLWEHWRDRRPAYLIVTMSSVDARTTAHIFVEPDETGRWRAYRRVVRQNDEIDDLPTAYSVEWTIGVGWHGRRTPLSLGQAPDPTKHVLEFRDKCGDVEGSL